MELVAELNPVEQEKKRRSTERFIGLVVEPQRSTRSRRGKYRKKKHRVRKIHRVRFVVEPAIQKIEKREIQKDR